MAVHRWYAGLVTVAAIGLAGCTAEPEDAAGANVVTTSPVTRTTTTTTTTTTPALPTAADGTDVTACVDGVCEVLLSGLTQIPIQDPSVGVITVTAVDASGVDLQTVSPSGFQSVIEDQRPGQGGPSVINSVAIEVVALSGNQAVVKFSAA